MSIVSLVVSLGLGIYAAIYSDYWYMEKMNGLVREGEFLDDEGRATLAREKGGTSGWMVLAYFAMALVVSGISTWIETLLLG